MRKPRIGAQMPPGQPTVEAINESVKADRQLFELRNMIVHAFPAPFTGDPAIVTLIQQADAGYMEALGLNPTRPREPWIALPEEHEAEAAILRRNILRRATALGWSERKASLKAGLSESAIRGIRSGRIKAGRSDTIRKLANGLMCTPEDLTGATIFDKAEPNLRGLLRRFVARQFLEAEYWRKKAEAADNEGKSVNVQPYLFKANTLDAIDGPYEWTTVEKPTMSAQLNDALNNAYEKTRAVVESLPPGTFPLPAAEPHEIHQPQANKLPVYAAAQGGPEGSLVLDWNPVEYEKRPEPLASVPDAFGIYIVEESMAPAFEHGDVAFVHPRKPVTIGRNALFVRKTADGQTFAMVKRLEGVGESVWRVRQFNPDKKFTLKRSDWQQCLMIVGKYDRK